MKRGQCGTVLTLDDLSPIDRSEVEKFAQWIGVESARRNGADADVCDMLESAIYSEGVGREAPKADA